MAWRNTIPIRLLLLALLCGTAGPAQAQKPTQAEVGAIRQNCRADYESYCASVPPGTQASLQCLQQHQAQLSPPCRSAVAATDSAPAAAPPQAATQAPSPEMPLREEMALMRRACGVDYRTWCQGVRLGGGRAVACLVENRANLSPGCRRALAEARAMR